MEESVAIKTSALSVKANCTGCGGCLSSCPVGALSLRTKNDDGWGEKKAQVDRQICRECGCCIPACPRQSLMIKP